MDRTKRLDRARFLVQSMLLVGFVVVPLAVFLWVATPGFMGPQPWWEPYVPLVGIGGIVVGNVWLYRLARPRPEPEEALWRYRDQD